MLEMKTPFHWSSMKWTVTFTKWNISLCWRKCCEAEQNTAQSCLAADNQHQYHWAAETQGKMTCGSLEQFHDISNDCHCLASAPFKDGERNYNLESTLKLFSIKCDSGRAWLTEVTTWPLSGLLEIRDFWASIWFQKKNQLIPGFPSTWWLPLPPPANEGTDNCSWHRAQHQKCILKNREQTSIILCHAMSILLREQ